MLHYYFTWDKIPVRNLKGVSAHTSKTLVPVLADSAAKTFCHPVENGKPDVMNNFSVGTLLPLRETFPFSDELLPNISSLIILRPIIKLFPFLKTGIIFFLLRF